MTARVAGIFSLTLFAPTALRADEVEKVLFLLVEPGQVIASNTQTGAWQQTRRSVQFR
ncbi:MAG: hypothetical protein LJE58_14180 [Thiogranum sp.]|nr:hypothetical protein [Thiogranum sp.]